MGTCTYCGKPAGFWKTLHEECRQRHQLVSAKIPEFISQARDASVSAQKLEELTVQFAATGFVDAIQLRQLAASGVRQLVAAMVRDGRLSRADADRVVELRSVFGLTDNDIGAETAAMVFDALGSAVIVAPPSEVKRIPVITVQQLVDALAVYFRTIVGFKHEMTGIDSDRSLGPMTTITLHGPVVTELDRRSKIEVDISGKATTNMQAKLGSDQMVVHARSNDFDLGQIHLGLLVEPQADRSIGIYRITKWDHGQAYYNRGVS